MGQESTISCLAGFLHQVAFLAPSIFPLDSLACRVVSGMSLHSVTFMFLTNLCFLATVEW